MFRKTKSKLAVLLSLVLCVSMMASTNVFAADSNSELQNSIQPRVTCINPNCSQTSFSALVCDKDLEYSETSTHKYDFWTKTCTITWYVSHYLGYQCQDCGNMQLVGVDPSREHDCLRTHSSCGKDDEVYCRNDEVLPSV